MNSIYLIRSLINGLWLGPDGWQENMAAAYIYTEWVGDWIGPATNTEFVQFCECPL